ncbi:MAG: hypothetical protein K2H32_08545 [Muribaculaceae bacterium]|nr:hypothetical protein [Muribaculaceae bacterium]
MKIYTIQLLLLFGLIFSMPIYADNGCDDDYDIELTESDDNDTRPLPSEPKGKRSLPILIQCNIGNVNGVTIYSDEDTFDIVSYEIWDVDGEVCLGVYSSERQFLDALFANKGEYIVVFTAINKKYKGFIWLE